MSSSGLQPVQLEALVGDRMVPEYHKLRPPSWSTRLAACKNCLLDKLSRGMRKAVSDVMALSDRFFKQQLPLATWLSLLTAFILGIFGLQYAYKAVQLAKWTAKKDFVGYCVGIEVCQPWRHMQRETDKAP